MLISLFAEERTLTALLRKGPTSVTSNKKIAAVDLAEASLMGVYRRVWRRYTPKGYQSRGLARLLRLVDPWRCSFFLRADRWNTSRTDICELYYCD